MSPITEQHEPLTASHSGGSGSPVVLLHGLMGTWRVWRPILPALEGRHTVHALTLPGHAGGPSLPEGVAPTVQAMVDGVEAELDRLGIDRAHLVGNSLGGWISVELARRGRARSLVLFGPAGAFRSRRRLRVLIGGMRLSFFLTKMLARRSDSICKRRWVRKLMLCTQVHHVDRVPAEELAAAIRTSVDAVVVAPLLSTIGHDPVELLPENPGCPIRVVWAEKDRIIPFAHFGAPLMERLPGAELVRVPEIGHVPMYDDPDLIARLILDVTTACDAAQQPAAEEPAS